MEAISHLLRRVTEKDAAWVESTMDDMVVAMDEVEGTTTESDAFDPRIFWTVNAIIILILMLLISWCCYRGHYLTLTNLEERRQQTDARYQATVRERLERRQKAKVVSPDQRRQRLLQSFRRHDVCMTVEEKDVIADDPSSCLPPNSRHQLSTETDKTEENTDHHPTSDDLESNSLCSLENRGQLRLATDVLVPNCCAICLGEYDVGDEVVWSSNKECPHAFHQDCILDWLIKMQPQTPCPCCRQEFTDLELVRKEKKIVWSGNAFNLQSVGF